MEYNRDLFIFGEPIETKFGKVRFLTYKEYVLYQRDLYIINQNILHWYYIFLKEAKSDQEKESYKQIKEMQLLDFIKGNQQFLFSYLKIFSEVLSINEYDNNQLDDVLSTLFSNNDDFLQFRKLILEMNAQIEDEVSPNELIQSYIEKDRNYKLRQSKREGNGIGIMDIVTALVVGTPHSYEEIANMTILQVNAAYHRLAKFKDYDTTTLFATVSSDVKVSSWATHIDLFKQEKAGISDKEFNQKYGRLF